MNESRWYPHDEAEFALNTTDAWLKVVTAFPQLIQYATGVDMVTATLQAAMGDPFTLSPCSTRSPRLYTFVSNYMIYSTKSGTFSRLAFDPASERDNLLEVHCTAKPGDAIHAYQNTSHSPGTILLKATSLAEIQEITANIEKYYKVGAK